MNDPTTAASGDDGPPCGAHLRLCSDMACQPVVIKDACGGCGPYHLDLSKAAWELLGHPTYVEAQLLQQTEAPALLEPPTPPEPPPNIENLPVPTDLSIRYDGCASDGYCTWYNYYACWTHEIVLQGDEPTIRLYHERAHAHQAHTVYGDGICPPADRDLESWLATTEAQSFAAVADGWPWGAISTNRGLIEDHAETVAWYYLDPTHLLNVSPARHEWAKNHLP